MRASFTSSTRSGTLFHVRVTPPAVGLEVERVGIGLPPISASITAPNALADTQWAHGYSGCIGVVMSGVQPVSCMRAGLPPPLRIAVRRLRPDFSPERPDHGVKQLRPDHVSATDGDGLEPTRRIPGSHLSGGGQRMQENSQH